MVFKPKRPCNEPSCNQITNEGYCEHHKHSYDKHRETSHKRGYDGRWRRVRVLYLKNNPLCVSCDSRGRTVPATEVDHIVPHRQDKELFWNESNWQSLCKSCHSRKTQQGL